MRGNGARKVNQKRRAANRSNENDGSFSFKREYAKHAENDECPAIGRTCKQTSRNKRKASGASRSQEDKIKMQFDRWDC